VPGFFVFGRPFAKTFGRLIGRQKTKPFIFKKRDRNVGPAIAHPSHKQFQQKCAAVLRPELREGKSNSSKSAQRFCVRNCVRERAIPAKVRSGFASGIA
jgi:hypothetical protein